MNGALFHLEEALAGLYLGDPRAYAMRYLLRHGEPGARVVAAVTSWCSDWWLSAYVSAGLLNREEP